MIDQVEIIERLILHSWNLNFIIESRQKTSAEAICIQERRPVVSLARLAVPKSSPCIIALSSIFWYFYSFWNPKSCDDWYELKCYIALSLRKYIMILWGDWKRGAFGLRLLLSAALVKRHTKRNFPISCPTTPARSLARSLANRFGMSRGHHRLPMGNVGHGRGMERERA